MALDFRVRHSTCNDETSSSTTAADQLLASQVATAGDVTVEDETSEIQPRLDGEDGQVARASEFGVDPFFTACGPLTAKGARSGDLDFSLRAPTTSKNLFRVLRALQVLFIEFSGFVEHTSVDRPFFKTRLRYVHV